MRFSATDYDKVFPRPVKTAGQVETAVETFTPTADKATEQHGSVEEVETVEGGEVNDGDSTDVIGDDK